MLTRMWSKGNTTPVLMGSQFVQPLWESISSFLRKLRVKLPQDSAIPLLSIYPKDIPSYNKDTCSTMSTETLFMIARNWKQPTCPSTEEWINKLWKGRM